MELQYFNAEAIRWSDWSYKWTVESGRSEDPIEIAIAGARRADGLISSELKEKLLVGVNKLMDVPEHLKDWHPGFQWLFTDITVSNEGKVRFESYINNLHPVEHKELYLVLEEILEKFIPMFEDVLADMRVFTTKERRWPKQVDIPEFTPSPEPERYDLRGQKLQVIVKLANIELTPENPKQAGGSWHVEGMTNENIVASDASGIYYYHSEKVTESRLNFRIHVKKPEYEQQDHSGCKPYQSLDGFVTKEDLYIEFPNIFQHQVRPFELDDPIKPEAPILSTTNVLPQQKEWAPQTDLIQQAVQKLPAELVQEIERLIDWPIEMEEALALRLELMQERKYFVNTQNAEMFERKFYFCEH
ncbi:hypothetical protein BGZ82_006660 [Podila clonocystis]|nr:hypothetical protein BGZ82_006660 [Podila clonocystis]